jgi:hypothetical protein
MADYRYIFADILTNQVLIELPLYGVWFTRTLNGRGAVTLSFALDSEGYSNSDVLDATTPGHTALYIERNGELVWGGILWTRTYQAQSKSLSWTGETFETFLNVNYIEYTYTQTAVDARQIIRNLVDHMQQKEAASNLNIQLPSTFSTLNPQTITFRDYEVWSYAKAIEEIVKLENGPEWTIEVGYDSSGNPGKTLRVGAPLGASYYDTQLIFDYPGNISNYWYPENASQSAVSVIGIGAGEGNKMTRDKFTHQDLLNVGYPNIQQVFTNKDVKTGTQLGLQMRDEATRLKAPIVIPTIEVRSEMFPEFGDWNLGDYARIVIEDARFPAGQQFPIRIVGYEVRPSSSESAEDLKLVIAGTDGVA